MVFCVKCGAKYGEDSKFCNECGANLTIKSKNKREIEEEPDEEELTEEDERLVEQRTKEFLGYEPKKRALSYEPKKKSRAWLWIIIIIVIIVVVLSVQQGGVSINSRTDKGFLSSTHETTKCGIFGCKTESKSCPFWDRDC